MTGGPAFATSVTEVLDVRSRSYREVAPMHVPLQRFAALLRKNGCKARPFSKESVMNHTTRGIAALVIATGLGISAPAQADPDPIDGCTAQTNGLTVGECIFVATGGLYEVGIDHDGRYGWTRVDCIPLGGYFVDAWDTEGGRDVETTSFVTSLCTVTVATDGGPGFGWVDKI